MAASSSLCDRAEVERQELLMQEAEEYERRSRERRIAEEKAARQRDKVRNRRVCAYKWVIDLGSEREGGGS